MPDMASPDHPNFAEWKSLDYSDPCKVTVRSSWWPKIFFGYQEDRDDYLQRLSSAYLDANSDLLFEGIFSGTDDIVRQFLSKKLGERVNLNRNDICNITYGWKRGKEKPSVSEV